MNAHPHIEHPEWLAERATDLFTFGRGAALIDGGFGLLDERGKAGDDASVDLLITCRMTHVYAIGALLGSADAGALMDHGMTALLTKFADPVYGGWFSRVDRADGRPVSSTKDAYTHAFVLLAATSALHAGHRDARVLLDAAVDVIESHFWDEGAGWMQESWDRPFGTPEAYRGANSNMHSVEAFLAAADATGDPVWLERALRIADRLINNGARGNAWR